MRDASAHTDKIDAYLRRQMSGEESAAFEAEIKADPALQAELAVHLKALVAIRQAGLQTEQTQNPEDIQSPPVKPIWPSWTRVALAAGIVMLVAVGIWWLNRPASTTSLYSQYYKLPIADHTLRQAGPVGAGADIRVLYDAFSARDFTTVTQAYRALSLDTLRPSEASWAKLLAGLAHWELDSPDSASAYLSRADEHEQEARWFQALMDLQSGKAEVALA
ncbi:MAG: hypothetical protein AAFV07_20690, partial [Bacteroidota bacterium]